MPVCGRLEGTPAQWAANDLVIGDGELAVQHEDNGRATVRVGDGIQRFSQLNALDSFKGMWDYARDTIGWAIKATGLNVMWFAQGQPIEQGVIDAVPAFIAARDAAGIGRNIKMPKGRFAFRTPFGTLQQQARRSSARQRWRRSRTTCTPSCRRLMSTSARVRRRRRRFC